MMERFKMLLILALLVAMTNSERIGHSNYCADQCHVSMDEVGMLPTGKTHSYDYEGHTYTTITDSTKDHSGLKIKARVHVDVFSPCDMALRLSDVELHELDPRDSSKSALSPRSEDFARSVTHYPFHFATQPRRLQTIMLDVQHVCRHPSEPEWVTNFKKGILSNLQHRMKNRKSFQQDTETDILGRCPVSYIPIPTSDDSKTITRKVKDLNSCANRDSHYTSLPSSDYRLSSLQQTLPIMNASHSCDHTFNNERLESIVCTENHLFRPLSADEKGITTKINQKMTFLHESPVVKPKKVEQFRKSWLSFNHKFIDRKADKTTYKSTTAILEILCNSQTQGIQENTPFLFSELVYNFRKLTREQLESIQTQVKQAKFCSTSSLKPFFYDALAYTNTPAANDIMVDSIIQGELSAADINSWLTGMAFQKKRPTRQFLESLLPIINHNVLSKKSQTLLGLSSLVHLYCQSNTVSCETDEIVTSILKPITNLLGDDCSKSDPATARLALKALGNVGLKKISPLLTSCAKQTENPISVRVTALQAYRRVPCSSDRSHLLSIVENFDFDSELRIQAYLAVMTCPDTETLFKVKSLLAREKVNQVGSFIWTHLTNLRETSNPHKQELRQILEDSSLRAEFNLDKLKFSRNVEKSYLSPIWNVGGQMESNLIWSQNSFLPRSASLNLTADLYGRAYNFLNIETRVEGLESLLERLIGPEGYLTKSKAASNSVNTQALYKEALKKVEGSLGIQIFGQEIAFLDLVKGGLNDNAQFNIFDILIQLTQERRIDFTKNVMLADSTISLATGLGLPMTIEFNTTASIQLKTTTKFDLGKRLEEISIKSHLKPSAALRVSGIVSMDAAFSKYGVRLISTIQTNTHANTEITSRKFETFDFKMDVPQNSQQLVNFASNVFIIHPDYERPVVAEPPRMKSKQFCSNEMIQEILGLKICSTFSYPNLENLPRIPLAGAIKASVIMDKTDTQTGYKLSATLKSVMHPSGYTSRFLRFEIDTPKSRTPRRFLGDLTFDVAQRNMKAEFVTPWKSALAEIGFRNDDSRKRLVAQVRVDEWDIVKIEGSRTSESTNENGNLDVTNFIFNVPILTKNPITAVFKSKQNGDSERAIDFSVNNLFKKPVKGKAVIQYRQSSRASLGGKYVFSAEYETMFGNGVIQGSSQKNDILQKFQASLRHMNLDSENTKPYIINLFYKLNDKSNDALTKVFSETSVSHGFDQENLYRLNLQIEKAEAHIKSKYEIQYGDNGNGGNTADIKTISGQVFSTLVVNGNKNILESGYSFVHPTQSINQEAKISASWSPSVFISTLAVKDDNQEVLYVSGRYVANYDILKINTGLHYKTSGHNFELENELKETSLHNYEFTSQTTYNSLQYFNAVANLRIPSLWNIKADGRIYFGENASNQQQPMKFTIAYNAENPNDAVINVEFQCKKHGINHSMKLIHFSETDNRFYNYKSEITLKSPKDEVKISSIAKNNPGDMHHEITFQLSKLLKYAIFTKLEASPEGESKNELSFSVGASYPGRDMEFNIDWALEHLKMNSQIGLQWAKDKLISLHSMYDIDDGWTQKGLTASLTLNTPFENYKQTHLGINALGQLRYRRVDIEYRWGNKKRIRFDVIVEPKTAQDFLATITLITPYPKLSYVGIHSKYQLTDTHLITSATCDLGPKEKYSIDFDISNNGYYDNNNIRCNLRLRAGRESEDITFNFQHKDTPQSAKSNLKIDIMQQTTIEAGYDLTYKLLGYHLETQGSAFAKSSHPQIGDNKISWSHNNNEEKVETLLSVSRDETDLLKSSLKTYWHPDKFKLDARFKTVGMNEESSAKLRYRMNENEGRLSTDLFITPEYNYKFIALSEERKDTEITLMHEVKLKTTHNMIPYIEYSSVMTTQPNKQEDVLNTKSNGKIIYGTEKKILCEYNREMKIARSEWTSKTKYRSVYKPLNGLEINARISSQSNLKPLQYSLDVDNKQGFRFTYNYMTTVDQTVSSLDTSLTFTYNNHNFNASFAGKLSPDENSFDLNVDNSLYGQHRLYYKLLRGRKFDFELILDSVQTETALTIDNSEVTLLKFLLKTTSIEWLKLIDILISYDHINGQTRFVQTTEFKWGFCRTTAAVQLRDIDNLLVEFKINVNGHKKAFKLINFRDVATKLYKTNFDFNYGTEIQLNSVLRLSEPLMLNFSLNTNLQPVQTIRLSFLNQLEYPNSIRHVHAIKFKSFHRSLAIENRFEIVGTRYVNVKAHLMLPLSTQPMYHVSYDYNRRPSGLTSNIKLQAWQQSLHASINLGQNDMRLTIGSSHPDFKNLNVMWRVKIAPYDQQSFLIAQLEYNIRQQRANIISKLDWVVGTNLDYLSLIVNGSISNIVDFAVNINRQLPNSLASIQAVVNNLSYLEAEFTNTKQMINLQQNDLTITLITENLWKFIITHQNLNIFESVFSGKGNSLDVDIIAKNRVESSPILKTKFQVNMVSRNNAKANLIVDSAYLSDTITASAGVEYLIDRSFTMAIEVTTPIYPQFKSNELKLYIDLQRPTISLDAKFGEKDYIKFNTKMQLIELDIDLPNINNVKIKSHAQSLNGIERNLEIHLRNKWSSPIVYAYKFTQELTKTVEISTPVELKGIHYKTFEKYTPQQSEYTLNMSLVQSASDINIQSNLQIQPNRIHFYAECNQLRSPIKLSGEYSPFNVKVSYRTPFNNFESGDFDLQFKLPQECSLNVEVSVLPKPITASWKYSSSNIQIKVSTPLAYLEDVDIQGNWNETGGNFEINHGLLIKGIVGTFTYDKLSKFKMQIKQKKEDEERGNYSEINFFYEINSAIDYSVNFDLIYLPASEKPITIEANYNSKTIDRQIIQQNFNLTSSLLSQAINLSGKFDRIAFKMLEINLNASPLKFDFKYDINLNGEIKVLLEKQPEMMYSFETTWSFTKDKLLVELALKTNFEVMKLTTATVEITGDHTKSTIKLDMRHNRIGQITGMLQLTGMYSEGDYGLLLQIQTPFQQFKTSKVSITLEETQLKIDAESSPLLSSPISLTLQWELIEKLQIDLMLTTPFDQLKSLQFKVIFSPKENIQKLIIEESRLGTLSVIFHKNYPNYALDISTPFSGFDKNKITFKFLSKKSYEIKATSPKLSQPILLSINLESTSPSFILKTPFEYLQNTELKANIGVNSIVVNLVNSYLGEYSLTVEQQQVATEESSAVQYRMKCVTPFENYRSIDAEVLMNREQVTIIFNTARLSSPIKIDVKYKYLFSEDKSIEVQINSPFTVLKSVNAKLGLNFESDRKQLALDVNYNNDLVMSKVLRLNMKEDKSFDFEFDGKTNRNGYEQINLFLSLIKPDGLLKFGANIPACSLNFNVNAQYQNEQQRNILASFNLTSNYEYFRNNEISLEAKRNNDGQIHQLKLQMRQESLGTAMLQGEQNLEGGRNEIRIRGEVNYSERENNFDMKLLQEQSQFALDFDSSLLPEPINMRATINKSYFEINLKSPFNPIRNLHALIKLNIDDEDGLVMLLLNHNLIGEYTFETSYQLKRFSNLSINLKAGHNQITLFSTHLSVSINNQDFALQFGTDKVQNLINLAIKISKEHSKFHLKTETYIKDTLIEYKTSYKWQRIGYYSGETEASINLKLENTFVGSYAIDYVLKYQPKVELNTLLKITTPFENYQDNEVSFIVDRTKFHAMLMCNAFQEQPVSLLIEWNDKYNSLDIKTKFTSPIGKLKLIDLALTIPKSSHSFSPISAKLQINDISPLSFSHKCNSFDQYKLDCTTTFETLKRYSAEVKLNMDRSTSENQKYSINVNSNPLGEYELVFNSQFTSDWTSEQLVKVKAFGITRTVTLTSNLQQGNFKGELLCSRNGLWMMEITGVNTNQMSLKLKSPIQSGSLDLQIQDSELTLKISDETSNRNADLKLVHSSDTVLLQIKSNIEGYEALEMKTYFSLQKREAEVSVSVNQKTTSLKCLISTLKTNTLAANCQLNNQLFDKLPAELSSSLEAQYSPQITSNENDNYFSLKIGSRLIRFTIFKTDNQYNIKVETPFKNIAFKYILDYTDYLTLNKFAVDAIIDETKYGLSVAMVAKSNSLTAAIAIEFASQSANFIINANKINRNEGDLQTYLSFNQLKLVEINTQWSLSNQETKLKWNVSKNNNAIFNIKIATKLINNRLDVATDITAFGVSMRSESKIQVNTFESSHIAFKGEFNGMGLEKSIKCGFKHNLTNSENYWTLDADVEFMENTYKMRFYIDKQDYVTIKFGSALGGNHDVTVQVAYKFVQTSLDVLASIEQQSILGGRYTGRMKIAWEKSNLATNFTFEEPNGKKYEIATQTQIVQLDEGFSLTNNINFNNALVTAALKIENGAKKSIFIDLDLPSSTLKTLMCKAEFEWSSTKIYGISQFLTSGIRRSSGMVSFNIIPQKIQAMGELKVEDLHVIEVQFEHKMKSSGSVEQFLGVAMGDTFSASYHLDGQFTPLFIGKLEIMTPIQAYNKIILQGSVTENNEISYTLNVDNSENLRFQFGSNDNEEQTQNRVMIKSPYTNAEIAYVRKRNKRSVTANFESSNRKKSVQLDYEPKEGGFEGKLLLPESHYTPPVALHLKHEMLDNNKRTFVHRFSAGAHNAEFSGDWQQQDSDDQTKFNARFTSSYNGGKEVKFSASRQKQSNHQYDFEHNLQYKMSNRDEEYQHIQLKGSHNLDPYNFNAHAVIKTPFENLKHMEIKHLHSIEQFGHLKVNHMLTHENRKLFHLQGEYLLTRSQYKLHTIIKCHRQYHPLLPKHFEILSSHGILEGGKHEFNHHMIYSPQFAETTQFKGNFVRNRGTVTADLMLKTPIKRIQSIRMLLNDNRKPDQGGREFTHSLHINEVRVAHINGAYHISRSNGKVTLSVDSVIPHLRKVNLQVLHHILNKKCKHHISFHHHDYLSKPITFKSSFDFNNGLYGDTEFTSPWHRLSNFKIHLSHQGPLHKHQQSFQCHLNERIILRYTGKVHWTNKNFHHQLELPLIQRNVLSEIKQENSIFSILMKCHTPHKSNIILFKHTPTETSMESNLGLFEKVKLERSLSPGEAKFVLTVNDANNIQLELKKKGRDAFRATMKNNILKFSSFNTDVEVKSDNKELSMNWSYDGINHELSVKLGKNKFDLRSSYPMSIEITAENSEQKLFVQMNIDDSFKMTVEKIGESRRFSLQHSCRFIQLLNVEAVCKPNLKEFNMITRISSSQPDNTFKIKLTDSFAMELSTISSRIPKISVNIQPVAAVGDTTRKYKAILLWNDLTSTINVEHNNEKFALDLTSNVPNLASWKFELLSNNLVMTYSNSNAARSDLSVNGKWTLSSEMINLDISSTIMDEKLSMLLNIQNTNNNRQFGLHLKTTFVTMETLKVNAALRNPENNLFGEAGLQFNQHKFTIDRVALVRDNEASLVKGLIRMTSTCKYIRSISVECSLKYTNSQVESVIILNVNEYNLKAEMSKNDQTYNAKVSGFDQNVEIKVSPQQMYAAYHSSNQQELKYSTQIDFKSINDFSLELTCPYPYVINPAKLTVWQEIQASNNVFKHKSTFTLNNNELLNIDINVDAPSRRAKILLANPVKGSVDISQPKNNELHIQVQNNNQKYSLITTWNFDTNKEINAVLNTPFRKVHFSGALNDNLFSAKFIPNMIRSSKSWEISVMKEEKGGLKVSVVTPVRSITVNYLHNRESTGASTYNIESKIEIVMKSSQLTKTLSVKQSSTVKPHQITGKIELNIPYLKAPLIFENILNQRPGEITIDSTMKLTKNSADDVLLSIELKKEPQKKHMSATLARKSTNLLLTVNMNSERSHQDCKYSLDVTHLNSRNVKQTSSIIWDVKKGQSLSLSINTPIKSLSIRAFKLSEKLSDSYSIEISSDNRKVSTKLQLSAEPLGITAQINNNPDNQNDYTQFYIKYINERHIQTELFRQHNSKHTAYLLAYIKLKTEHVLQGGVSVSPNAYSLLNAFSGVTYFGIKSQIETVMEEMFSYYLREIEAIVLNIMRPIDVDFRESIAYFHREYSQIMNELASARRELYRMYRRNEFFVRHIYRAYRHISRSISMYFYQLAYYLNIQMDALGYYIYRTAMVMQEYLDYTVRIIDRLVSHCLTKLGRICKIIYLTARNCFENTLLKIHELLERLTTWIFAKAQWMNDIIEQYLVKVIEPLMKQIYRKALILLRSSKQLLSKIPLDKLTYFPFEGRLKILIDNMKSSIDQAITKYGQLLGQTSQQIADQINQYIDLETLKNMIGFFSETAQWIFDNIYTEEIIKAFVQREYKLIVDYVAANSKVKLGKMLKLDRFQLEFTGHAIKGQIYSPFVMHDLKSMPQLPDISQSPALPEGIKKLIPNYNILSNAYTYGYELPPLIDTEQGPWIPDFNSYGSVTDKHVITFDKRHFNIEGRCKVLLAGLNNKWNVYLINNDDNKQIEVQVHNKIIAINSDYNVNVNGRSVELPLTISSLTVIRVGPIVKLQDNVLGFSVTSDLDNDIHTVGVSGWHHAKVQGLLGNRDNEPYNDFKDKTGEMVTEENFLQSWTVDGQCTISTEKRHFDQNKACNFLFKCPVSPLARCFKKINPRPFLRMCKQTKKCHKCPVIRVCKAARVYALHCRKAHVKVRLPHPCRRCKSEISDKPSADVVIVLPPQCSRKELLILPAKIKEALSANGITSARFGLASVGGSENIPYSYTMNKGQMMSENHQHIVAALNQIIAAKNDRILEKRTDPLHIVKYAAKSYPWKLNAARHVILVQCSLCPAADYKNEIANLLKINDIKLHHFLPQRFSYSDQIEGRRGLGITKERIFSDRHPAGLPLPPALHLPLESNACLRLALNSGGSVFDSQMLLTSGETTSPSVQRKWMKIFAVHVASQSKPRCDCSKPSYECVAFCKLAQKSASSETMCQIHDSYSSAIKN